jgi:hypothetical protein
MKKIITILAITLTIFTLSFCSDASNVKNQEEVKEQEPQRLADFIADNIQSNFKDWKRTSLPYPHKYAKSDTSKEAIVYKEKIKMIFGEPKYEIYENKKCGIKIVQEDLQRNWFKMVSPDTVNFDIEDARKIYFVFDEQERHIQDSLAQIVYQKELQRQSEIIKKLCK